MSNQDNRRILLIDDNEAIHEDFKKILLPADTGSAALDDMRSAFLGTPEPAESTPSPEGPTYELFSAFQGEDGYKAVCTACDEGNPYAMAFVDMRMPPGWDGVETIAKLWERDPDLHVVICTAFSDYTWDETVERLGQSDRLLILKKPFDAVEISQLAAALTEKWNLTVRERRLLEETRASEQEARAYASSLETVNRALVTSQAASDMALDLRTDLLVQVSKEVNVRLSELLGRVESFSEAAKQVEMTGELESVLGTSHHLLGTLDELLDVTSLERGNSSVELKTCSPREIVSGVVQEFLEIAQRKGVELNLQVEGGVPELIKSEPIRVRQVIRSLVENAVSFTDGGTVTVALGTGRTEDWQRPRLQFEVRDTGSGISQVEVGSLFEPHPRAEDGSSRCGYGFGLSLARRLAALIGGELTARSEEGQGSAFSLSLEYSPVSQESVA
ncbi:MAG: two-component system sensor histidine kinase/response regulator [Planctomycetota bacterium]|jgi:two-component system sensor histidine kinase/response regulator